MVCGARNYSKMIALRIFIFHLSSTIHIEYSNCQVSIFNLNPVGYSVHLKNKYILEHEKTEIFYFQGSLQVEK